MGQLLGLAHQHQRGVIRFAKEGVALRWLPALVTAQASGAVYRNWLFLSAGNECGTGTLAYSSLKAVDKFIRV